MTILANKGGSKTADGVKTGKFTQSDLMEAMLGAADITTNFARGGTVTKMLNKYLVPFLNPSVQGADKFVRNITDRKGFKAWASLAIKAAALGILPELLNGLLYRDDDEWDDIPDQTKSNYYLFKLGDGYWMKIPRGRALAVFSAGATYAQEKAKGNDPKFSDVIEVVKSNVAPTDIFNQNIATAWTQTKLFNPDNPGTTWYGGNIESDRLQNYRPGERYDEKTDELSKWIGKTFNLSPKKINYLLDQYSGVVGDLLLPWFTPSATASSPALAPLKQAFMLDSTSTNKTTGEYYDLLDDLKYDANDGDIGAGITRKYVSHAGDEVNDYYQQIRAIQSDENLTKAEKNRLVRALKAQLIERQKEIIAQAEPYREAVSDYLKAHPELSTDNDAAIAEYAEQYEITEDQAESRMDAIVYREANREVFGRGVCAAHLQRGRLRQGPRRVCQGRFLRDVLRLLFRHQGDARRQGRERQEHFRIEEGKSCGVHQQPGHSAGAEGRSLRCGRVHSEEREESEVERRFGRLRRPARKRKEDGAQGPDAKSAGDHHPEVRHGILREGGRNVQNAEGERERDRGLHEDGERDGHSESRDAGKEEGAQGRKPDGVR